MKPIEIRMFGSIARNAAIATPFLAFFAFILRGWKGAVSAAIAVALVIGIFALSAFPMAWASKISTGLVGMTAGIGFVFRLVMVGIVLVALSSKPFIDKPSFILAFMLTYLGLIAFEARSWINFDPRPTESNASPVAENL